MSIENGKKPIPWYPIALVVGMVLSAIVTYYSSQISFAEELGNITPKSIHCALVRFGIPITKSKHQSRANRTSPKAAKQRREKLGLRHSYLQRQLAWFLARILERSLAEIVFYRHDTGRYKDCQRPPLWYWIS